jgi:hypothetical protein
LARICCRQYKQHTLALLLAAAVSATICLPISNLLATAVLALLLQILGVHLQRRGLPLADDVSIEEIATMTMGFTGADLANLVNEVRASRCSSACSCFVLYM